MTATTIRLGQRLFRTEVLDLSAPGKGHDAYLAADGFAAVADGSTPLQASVSGRTVAQFAERVLEALLDHAGADRVSMVRAALAQLGSPTQAVEDGVSCTVGVVRVRDDRLEAGVLGDCAVVARSRTNTVALTDDRLEPYDSRAAELFASNILAGADEAGARAAVAEMLLEHRRLANTAGAYWLMTGDERAAAQWRWTPLPDDTTAVLLCTDGFTRLIKPLRAYPDEHMLLRAAETKGLPALGCQLRNLETAPNSLARAARLSRHDDATALLLRAVR